MTESVGNYVKHTFNPLFIEAYTLINPYSSSRLLFNLFHRSLPEKARRYGINLSELMRKAIEEEIRKKEVEWALNVMEEISEKARLDGSSNELIRESRAWRS
jgi:post-segregation antitoxin (ccd killing protein)